MKDSGTGRVAADDHALPFDLHFADPRSLSLDYEAIVERGQTLRRNRKLVGGAAAVGLLGTAAFVGACVQSTTNTAPPASGGPSTTVGFYTSEVVTNNPPIGDHVTALGSKTGSQPTGLSLVAWLSANNELCLGSADLNETSSGTVVCTPAADALTHPGAAVLVANPTPVSGFAVPGYFPAIGFMRGSAARITVTYHGTTLDASPVDFPAKAGTCSAYAIWLPVQGSTTVSSGDISRVVAYDAHGTEVASIP
jgi:hypothetical protein